MGIQTWGKGGGDGRKHHMDFRDAPFRSCPFISCIPGGGCGAEIKSYWELRLGFSAFCRKGQLESRE